MSLSTLPIVGTQPEQKTCKQEIFENSEYVTTNGAARYLTQLLGKRITANAIRLRVHRGYLKPEKPFGAQGESIFRVSELRLRFTRTHQRRR